MSPKILGDIIVFAFADLIVFAFAVYLSALHSFTTSLSSFHRWDFDQTSQEWSLPTLVVHAASMLRFTAQNGRQS